MTLKPVDIQQPYSFLDGTYGNLYVESIKLQKLANGTLGASFISWIRGTVKLYDVQFVRIENTVSSEMPPMLVLRETNGSTIINCTLTYE